MTARASWIRDLVGGLALGLIVAGWAAELLPPDLKVVTPPLSVPRENARFGGRRVGN